MTIANKRHTSLSGLSRLLALAMCGIMISLAYAGDAYAAPNPTPTPVVQPPAAPPPAAPPATEDNKESCTDNPAYSGNPIINGSGQKGIISSVVEQIQTLVKDAAQKMFKVIVANPSFQTAIWAAMTLFIALYGAGFLMGVVNLTLGEGVVRLVKLGIIFTLISPDGWNFFNTYVVDFFTKGTDDLIEVMTSIAVGGTPGTGGGNGPLAVLDSTVRVVFSFKMFITLATALGTGPYGVMFTALLLYSLGTFIRAVLQAAWVYLMAIIAKMLLFGLAPIFISFLLFNRTKQLFDGWLGQLVNYSLQPILLFAFLGFYTVLIESSLKSILSTEMCWVPLPQSWLGSIFELHMWRFMIDGKAYTGGWGWLGATGVDGSGNPLTNKVFPIDVVDVLIFLLLAQLAWRYTQVVVSIAREIAGSGAFLSNIQGALSGYFGGAGNKAKTASGGALRGADVGGGQRGIGGAGGVRGVLG